MEEITKLFKDYYKQVLEQVPIKTKEAIKEEVDNFSNQFEKDLQKTIPVDTGGLLKSLTKTKEETSDYYGYKFEFKGVNKNGVPYAKIANTLNYGRDAGFKNNHKYSAITPRRFIFKAIKKLKKLDKAIIENYENKMQDLNKES